MRYFKEINKGNSPKRLLIGGVHGNEGKTTIHALYRIDGNWVKKGKLNIYNFDKSSYISTLDRHYYTSKRGQEIISIIKRLKPTMYVELHCYNSNSFQKLTGLSRVEVTGVPPLIHLEYGVLIGSLSPYIRTSLFKMDDVCITLEIPCEYSKKSMEVYLKVIGAVTSSCNKKELLDMLSVDYKKQINTAAMYAGELYWDGYPPL